MQGSKDNEMAFASNDVFDVKVVSTLGDRDEQQDNFGYSLIGNRGLIVICDGMGGYAGGKKASRTAVASILANFEKINGDVKGADTLKQFVLDANKAVCELDKNDPECTYAGTTCVMVFIDHDQLTWCSVGDSRAYIQRRKKYYQITQDHNYKTVLDGQLNEGTITSEDYETEIVKGEALINYLGMPNIELIDFNNFPLALRGGDKVVLMSDGLYKFVNEDDIFEIFENFKNINDISDAFERKKEKIVYQTGLKRDNMTFAVITKF